MFKEYNFEKTPVVDIVNEIILDAAKHNASDIHFDPAPNTLKIRIRIDGDLVDYATVPQTVKNPMITRVKIIAGMNITESRLPQDGSIKKIGKNNIDLRVSSLPTVYGEKIVIRILDYSMSTKGLENLGFTEDNYNKIKELTKIPNGIILITGATGTGKSTTLYTMLESMNTVEKNIITVEDPVEMKLDGINQVQAMSDIGLTFANALRSILRQDPDIIMIGEIRDDETARIAVRASITGHLVLSTLHTNNSLNTIERLLDMDVERYLLGSALSGVISQRLVKRLCPKCRTSRPATEYEKNVFKKVLNTDINEIYTPVGCDECLHGYKGRLAIQEVLIINQEIKDAITSNLSKENLRHLVYNDKTSTLLEDGLTKVIEGLTSFDEVLRVIDIQDDLGEKDNDIKNALIGKKENNQDNSKENEEDKQNIKNDSAPQEDTINQNDIKNLDNNVVKEANDTKEEKILSIPETPKNNDNKESEEDKTFNAENKITTLEIEENAGAENDSKLDKKEILNGNIQDIEAKEIPETLNEEKIDVDSLKDDVLEDLDTLDEEEKLDTLETLEPSLETLDIFDDDLEVL